MTAVIFGATLTLIDYKRGLEKNFCKNLITLATIPGRLLNFLHKENRSTLKTLIVAGESVSEEKIAKYLHVDNLINAYGPTEPTICTSEFKIVLENLKANNIGKPISNAQMYILDGNQQLVPVGVAGEICIGGIGLARGYINRADLTAEKFIANPFGNGDRIYQTGDLGRYLPDGSIEFLGRVDNQVKIRGFRVELGEIESVIDDCEQVKTSVALAKDSQLVAYIVPSGTEKLEESNKFRTQQDEEITVFSGKKVAELVESVRAKISQKLPEYMVPSHFIVLETIPLTPNGKTDGKLLQALDAEKRLIADEYVAPRSEVERKLCDIWQEVLHLDKVGINDNFFKIGGHSLLAVQVVSIAQKYGFSFSVKDLFLSKNISTLPNFAKIRRIGDVEFYPDETTPSGFIPFISYDQKGLDPYTIFFFPPGEGGAETYARNLVPLITKKE